MKYVFIVNPVAGNRDSSDLIKRINEYCLTNGIEYEIEITKDKKDATLIAKKYKHDNVVLFACGGDGTLSEVLNGMINSKNRLSLIPCGSGNDFYRTISKCDEKEFDVDLGIVNDTYFINVACIGIDAEIGNNAELMKKRGIAPNKIYNASIIYTFLNYRNKKLEIETENSINANVFTMLTVCNAGYYGGGYNIAPYADLSDGFFDLYVIRSIPKLYIPYLIAKLKKGKHEEDRNVEKMMVKRLVLRSKKPLVCNVDGEIIKDTKFKFKVVKHGVKFYQDKELVRYVLGE